VPPDTDVVMLLLLQPELDTEPETVSADGADTVPVVVAAQPLASVTV
jgi:hypothetical protein